MLDIRTNEGPARKKSRRRRGSSSSSSCTSDQKLKRNIESKEIARLWSLLAEKEEAEKKRKSQQKQDSEDAKRRKEFQDFEQKVLAMLPKQERTEPMQGADVEAEGLWSAKDVKKMQTW